MVIEDLKLEIKLLVIIAFILFIILAFLVISVSTYFLTKSEELNSTKPVTAKKWELHGAILMVFGLVGMLMIVGIGVYVFPGGMPDIVGGLP